jgi:hypothetical protein
MLFASMELNQNKSIVKEAFLKVFKLSSPSGENLKRSQGKARRGKSLR